MAFGAPQTLSAAHHKDAFDCGKLALNDWLVRRALQAQASGSAKVYVIPDGDRVAGYFALSFVAMRVEVCGRSSAAAGTTYSALVCYSIMTLQRVVTSRITLYLRYDLKRH